jgi:hypothetical protein
MLTRTVLIALGVYLLLVGLLTVTNIEVVWSRPIMGFAALVAGGICLFTAARKP